MLLLKVQLQVVKTNMKREAGHCCKQVKSYMNSCIPVRRLVQTNATETIQVARFHITPGERESRVLTNVYTHRTPLVTALKYHYTVCAVQTAGHLARVSTIPCDRTELIRLTISTVSVSVLTSDITEMNGFRDNTLLQIYRYPRLAIIPPNGVHACTMHIVSITWTQ